MYLFKIYKEVPWVEGKCNTYIYILSEGEYNNLYSETEELDDKNGKIYYKATPQFFELISNVDVVLIFNEERKFLTIINDTQIIKIYMCYKLIDEEKIILYENVYNHHLIYLDIDMLSKKEYLDRFYEGKIITNIEFSFLKSLIYELLEENDIPVSLFDDLKEDNIDIFDCFERLIEIMILLQNNSNKLSLVMLLQNHLNYNQVYYVL